MNKTTTLILSLLLIGLYGNAQNEDIVNRSLEKFEKRNDSIFTSHRGPSVESFTKQYIIDRQGYEKYLGNVIDKNLAKGLTYDIRENVFYDNIEDADDTTSDEYALSQLDYFSIPIKLKNGDSVVVDFGRTKDFTSSYQKVKKIVITSLNEILNEANKELLKDSIPPIKRIYISASSNGKHSKNSNHYRKEALDISRINGQMIAYHHFSFRIKEKLKIHMDKLNYNDYKNKYFLLIEEMPYNLDEIFLWNRLEKLQKAILNHKFTRENYGPLLNTKYDKKTKKLTEYDYVIPGHHNHIHFSVR
ncbi:hypothetical protein [uncultured Aquimarina sp.]|uniref:hypothetical protein n=1 Tax=uncultured Aquimarina sp. TaxID=575652 RepID=UPI002605E6A5|nr:hypothetical protein [uncultured Aquimarina sp.]